MNNKNGFQFDRAFCSRCLSFLGFLGVWFSFSAFPVHAGSYVYETQPNLAIIDNACVSSTVNVPSIFTINDLKVGVNLSHTYRSDLSITLFSPLGNSVQLYRNHGSSADNLDILLDDSAPSSISYSGSGTHYISSPYYENRYAPYTSLSTFDGLPAKGNWVLKVCDNYSVDNGIVYRVKLDFDGTAGGGGSPSTLFGNGPRSFVERKTAEYKGNFEYVGNTLMHCVSGCTTNNHNASPMSYVDIDGDASTFNSSSANISLPDNAEVTWAGLYWGGTAGINTSIWTDITATPNASKKHELKLKVPGGAYKKITANVIDTIANDPASGWVAYQAHADVTDLVKAAGEGQYTVADVQLDTGGGYDLSFTGAHGGWNLVVYYKSETEQYRRMTIWDGFDFVYFSDANHNFTIDSIRTPPSGSFETEVAFTCYDGELDTSYGAGYGDFLAVGTTDKKLNNSLNPGTNVCNGSISKAGNNVTTRNPFATQNWSFDVDRFSFNDTSIVPNNATSVTAIFGSDNEGIWFGNLVLSTELFIPPEASKSFVTSVVPAEKATDMTISLKNPNVNGLLQNISFTDTYPTGLRNAASSVIKSNTCGGSLTASPNATSLSFSGASLNAGESCSIVVSVLAANSTVGDTLENCTSEIMSTSTSSKGDIACASVEIADSNTTILDFGDAPASYGDASHTVVSGLYLGLNAPDTEDSSQHTYNAYGDGEQVVDGSGTWYLSGDEDGAPSQPVLQHGTYIPLFPVLKMTATSYSADFTVTNATAGNAKLYGWIDFDGNGSFDTNEAASVNVVSGTAQSTVTLNWNVPVDIQLGTTFIRLRLTTDTSVSTSTPTGEAADGEVEDFTLAVAIDIPPDSNAVTVINGETPQTCQSVVFEDDFDDVAVSNHVMLGPNRGAGGGTVVPLRDWTVSGGGSDTYARVHDASNFNIGNVNYNMGSAIYLGNGAVRRISPAIGSAFSFDAEGRLTTTIDAIELRDAPDDTTPGTTSIGWGTEAHWGPEPVTLSRTFTTVAGRIYRLYFKAIPEDVSGSFVPGVMRVDVPGGGVHFKIPASNEGIASYAIEFTANSTSSTISFVNYGHVNAGSSGWCDPASEYNNNPWCTVGGGDQNGNELILDEIVVAESDCGKGNISGLIYSDVNGNDTYDAGSESGLPSIAISVYDDKGTTGDTSDDVLVLSTSSTADGSYTLSNLSSVLSYRLEVDEVDSDLPEGSTIGTTNPLTGMSVATGETVTNQNFGFDPLVLTCPVGKSVIDDGGYASAVKVDQGVAYEQRALGVLTAEGATLNSANAALLSSGDRLVLDLGSVVPGSGELTISLARYGSGGVVSIATSVDDSGYNSLGTYGSGGTLGAGTLNTSDHVQVRLPTEGARYVQFTRNAGSVWVDGVAYDNRCMGEAFVCDGKSYISQSPDTSSATTLYQVAFSSGSANLNPVGNNSHGLLYNAIAYNPQDNYLYAMEIELKNNLLIIDNNGIATNLGSVSGLPVGSYSYIAGTFDNSGNLYISDSGNVSAIYKVNVATRTATAISLGQTVSIADMAFNPVDGFIYAVQSRTGYSYANRGQVYKIDPDAAAGSRISKIGVPNNTDLTIGALYLGSNGELYGLDNYGAGAFHFNIVTGLSTKIIDAPGTNVNDGANCSAEITVFSQLDFEDAPASYGLASHSLSGGMRLGATVTPDIFPFNSANADGDIDDGMTLPIFLRGESADISAAVSGSGGLLQGWIDWNGDGDFNDAAEQIASNLQDGDSDGLVQMTITVPEGAQLGYTFSRFRWSSTNNIGPTGHVVDGEVEDWRIEIRLDSDKIALENCPAGSTPVRLNLIQNPGFEDYVSCPDLSAANTIDNAQHWSDGHSTGGQLMVNDPDASCVSPRPASGWSTTNNMAGGISGKAWLGMHSSGSTAGEGATNVLVSPLIPGNFYVGHFGVTRANQSPYSYDGKLAFYGVNDTSAGSINSTNLNGGRSEELYITDPISNVLNWERTPFILSPKKGWNYLRLETRATNGASYVYFDDFHMFECQVPRDFGDAPLVYGAPNHGILESMKLGGTVTSETAGYNSPGADGDMDDGVTLPDFKVGGTSQVVVDAFGSNGYLQAWIDWNGDGDFADVGEQIASDLQDTDQNNEITFNVNVPMTATDQPTYARFRWSSMPGISPTEVAANGEVEDYPVEIQMAVPFVCSGDLYHVISKTFNKYNLSTGQYVAVGTPVDFEYSIGYRESDNLIYGIVTGDTGGTDSFGNAVAVGDIVRVDAEGMITRMSGTNTPANNHNAADIHQGRGTLWVRNGTKTQLSEVAINTGAILQTISLVGGAAINGEIVIVGDVAYRWLDGLLHRIQLPASGGGTIAASSVAINGVTSAMSGASAAFGFDDPDNPGTTVIYWPEEGTGDLYKITGIDTTSPVAVKVANTPSSSENDGASCPAGVAPFNAFAISGRVFEDLEYGGGVGRAFGSSGTVGLGGVTIEIYDANGDFLSKVTSAADGTYSLSDLENGDYYLRVVSDSVDSGRDGSDGSELPVMTYRSNGISAVVDEIGGRHPTLTDALGNNGGSQLDTNSFTFSGGSLHSQPAQTVQPITLSGGFVQNANFGFNFNTIVNRNNAGQGSLQQFVLNNNILSSTGIRQQLPALVAGDYSSGDAVAVFMIPTNQLNSSGEAIINSALTLNVDQSRIMIDGRVQAANRGSGEIILKGNQSGLINGVYFTENSVGSVLRDVSVSFFSGSGVVIYGAGSGSGNGVSIENTHILNNGQYGVLLENDATGSRIIGNTISGNSWAGIANDANPNNTFSQNSLSDNGGLGIDLEVDGVTANSTTDAWLNYPELTGGSISSNGTKIVAYDFDLNVPANTHGYRIEFFSNTTVDPTGHGEGLTYLGYEDIASNGTGLENFKGTINANQSVTENANIAVTVIEKTGVTTLGATSEFSKVRNGSVSVCTDLLSNQDPDAPLPTITIDENSSEVSYLEAQDEDGNPITYVISGGADADKFVIHPVPPDALFDCLTIEFIKDNDGIIGTRNLAAAGNGILGNSRAAPPAPLPGNYEVPVDSGQDNIYDLRLTATDVDGNSVTRPLSIVVRDVNEKPRITSSSSMSFMERSDGIVVDLQAYDPDENDAEGSGLTYSIAGGADARWFMVDAYSGELRFKNSPDYDSPRDQDMNNLYELSVRVTDDQGYSSSKGLMVTVTDDPQLSGISLRMKALLQGAYLAEDGLMQDALRSKGVLPVAHPYQSEPFNYAGSEQINLDLVAVEGRDAIVDWVLVELRAANNSGMVLASQAVLLQRDGDVMDAQTGATELSFSAVGSGEYYLSLRHRNHLGVMTAVPVSLGTDVVTQIDFSQPDNGVMGEYSRYTASVGEEIALLWSGDINHDHHLILNGQGSDMNLILNDILMDAGNSTYNSSYQVTGYRDTDLNMDGVTLFMGPDNDANVLLGNILTHPANDEFISNFLVNGGVE